jgi:hypothetical protein
MGAVSDDHNADADQEPTRTIFDQKEGVDWLLAWVVSFAERGVEMSVTLSIGGQLISGTVIGGRKYFEEMGAAMNSATFSGPTDAADLLKVLSDGFTGWKNIYPEPEKIPPDSIPQPTFIHLRNATAFMSDRPIRSTGYLWRCQLSRVDGFMLGAMTFA